MYKPIHDRAYKLQGLVKTTTNLECAQCQGNLKQEERHSWIREILHTSVVSRPTLCVLCALVNSNSRASTGSIN